MLFVGDDWAEAHHDIEIVDETGKRLVRRRLPEGLEGISRLHALIAAAMPAEWAELDDVEVAGRVKVGIETERGPWVAALAAAGYEVFAINPKATSRYRDRHSMSGAKSDPVMRTCWPRSCASIELIIARSPATALMERRSSWWPAATRP
jgi:hypothetical protein